MPDEKKRPRPEADGGEESAATAYKKIKLGNTTSKEEYLAATREKRKLKKLKKQEKREARENKDKKKKTEKREDKYKREKKKRDERRAKAANAPDKNIAPKVDKVQEVDDKPEVTEDNEEQTVEVVKEDSTKEKSEKKAKKEKKDKKGTKGTKEKKEKKNKQDKQDKETEEKEQDDEIETQPEPQIEPSVIAQPEVSGPYQYKQTAALTAVPESEVKDFLTEQNITIIDPRASSGTAVLRPILKFSHLPLSELLSKGPFASFTTPTPIQSASWPLSLSGRDVIGIAETGSGKTLAFSLPCVEALHASPATQSSGNGRTARARAVIVSPTRELAMQTHESTARLAAYVGLSAVCIYGGMPKEEQRQLLLAGGGRKGKGGKHGGSGADIIVATPGRLKDFIADGTVSLSEAHFVVLDEADRMLDKGFEDDIKEILSGCPPPDKRQTLMFTATWPMTVRALAATFMVDPVRISIGRHGSSRAVDGEDGEGGGNSNGVIELQANARITQKVEVVDPRGKEQRLLQILQQAQRGEARNDRILVFCLYKKEAQRVEEFLSRRGLKVAGIHGDMRQDQRTRSLEAFKSGTTTVLVATDVAARGLDIPEVKLVVNCTFPLTIEDYVHRIGRTGRAGKKGEAITLFTEHDKTHSGSLINILKSANQLVPDELFKFGTTVKKKAHDTYGAFYKDVDLSKKGTKVTFD